MKKNLPVFEFIIDDTKESGVKAVSIVTDPAFGSSVVYFSNKPVFVELKAMGKKQIVAGFSLLANVPVYRVDPEVGEYYGFFTAETIEKIVEKYHEEMLTNQVNLNHNENSFIDAYLVEDFIVNTDSRVADLKAKGLEHPNALGSWYTAFKIKDAEVFQSIVNSGNATGFSVEAFLDKVMVDFQKEVKNNLINNKVKTEMKKVNKSLKDKILAIFTEVEKLERVLVPELAFEIEWTEVGEPVNKVVVNENGEESLQTVGQGEFVTELGIVVVDEASNLVEVRDLPVEEAPEVPEIEVEDELAVSGDTAPSGNTETEVVASGDTVMEIPVMAKGVDMTIASLVDLKRNGAYMIDVYVENGQIVNATLTSQQNLLSKQEEIDALKLSVVKLEARLKEPITEPILNPEAPEVDLSKMTTYEKMMYRRGLKPV